MLQGSVDISMRVKGSKGAGTLYFTSIRREKGQNFEICESYHICILAVFKLNVSFYSAIQGYLRQRHSSESASF